MRFYTCRLATLRTQLQWDRLHAALLPEGGPIVSKVALQIFETGVSSECDSALAAFELSISSISFEKIQQRLKLEVLLVVGELN